MKHHIIACACMLVGLVGLVGCASAPSTPETTYFRLPPRAAVTPLEAPLFADPLSVDTLLADGLYSDQALLYSLDPEAARVRAYHYQLWLDPPVRMLQRRLIATLRARQVAPMVADRLPTHIRQVRVSGRIERFERVQRATGWVSVVSLVLRVDGPDGGLPLLLREYRAEVAASGASVRDSVAATGVALDQISADFLRDLQTLGNG